MSDASLRRSELISRESFDLIVDVHRRLAFNSGYDQALADVLSAAVFVAEEALRTSPPGADNRAVLYRFVATLEGEVRRLRGGDEQLTDGAGI